MPINFSISKNCFPALVSPLDSKSWDELETDIKKRYFQLQKRGIRHQDKCAILAYPDSENIVTLLALWHIGAIAIPTSPRFTNTQIYKYLRQINCKKIVGDDKIINKNFTRINLTDIQAQKINVEDLRPIDLNQQATILFTSGSSQSPRACLHTIANHYYSALGSNENIKLCPGDRWLLSLPLYHVAGLAILFRCLISGATIAIPAKKMTLELALNHLKPTHISLVATQLYRLLQSKSAVKLLQKTKAILLGGSSIPPMLINKALEKYLPIFTSYGSTEMASQITTTQPGETLEKMFTSGKILEYRELKIFNGNIFVKGHTLCMGYVDKDKIIPATNKQGWFCTGDSGYLDAQGYLVVTGRKDNMFISGGENIFPEEIERELLKIPNILHAVVVPLPHDEYGHRPVAFIQFDDQQDINSFDFSRLKKKLPGFKIPDRYFSWPEDIKTKGIKFCRTDFIKRAALLVENKIN